MKAEDTVMNFDEALMDAYENNNPTSDHAIGCRAVAKAQAEISFRAGYEKAVDENAEGWCDGHAKGIKEVVERSNEPCPHTGGFLKRDCDTCWQAQVKDWGL